MPKKKEEKIKEAKKQRYTERLGKLFFHTKSFVNSVEKENKYKDILYFYVKIAVLAIIVDVVFSVINLRNSPELGLSAIGIVFSSAFAFGLAFATPFISTAILHLGVLIFKGRQGFFNTFKPVTYGMAINAVYAIAVAVILGIIGLFIGAIPDLDQNNLLASMSNPNYLYPMLVSLIISVISLIHVLYAQVIGISRYQKISKLKAFFSILVISLIVILVVALIIIGMVYFVPISTAS